MVWGTGSQQAPQPVAYLGGGQGAQAEPVIVSVHLQRKPIIEDVSLLLPETAGSSMIWDLWLDVARERALEWVAG